MSDKNRELVIEGDRVAGVKDAPGPKHTPAPWRLEGPRFNAKNPLEMTGYDVYGPKDLRWVAAILGEHCNVPRSECEANARLMAAAPDLLSELKLAHGIIANALNLMPKEQKLAWDEANERDGLKDGMAMTRHNARRAVIAKAEAQSSDRCQICGKALGPREGEQHFDTDGVPRAWAHTACVEGRSE